MRYSDSELAKILERHAAWLKDERFGARADLVDADLTGNTILRGANLSRGNLARANLKGCDLVGANFAGAYLAGASFEGAKVREVTFGDASGVDLRGAVTNEL